MMTQHTFLLFLCLWITLAVGLSEEGEEAAPQTKQPSTKELADRQIEWLRNKGGFYSPKISINPLFESDSDNVPLGLFASSQEGFKKGETLMVVPRKSLLTTGDDESEDMCDTALNLVHQLALEEESDFEPYVSYVFAKDSVTLPSNFSPQARSLLHQIKGPNLPPHDLTDVSFANHCEHVDYERDEEDDEEDEQQAFEVLEFAYLTVVSRAWGDKLVPVFDMINHHSGRYANVDSTSIHGPDDITVHATRDIAPGEQLFLSYMDCIDEEGYELEYVLPQMLRDFGFVDMYPQRWIFPTPAPKTSTSKHEVVVEDLVLELDFSHPEDLDEQAYYRSLTPSATIQQPEMTLTWRTPPPSKEQVMFLKRELQRVESLKPHIQRMAPRLETPYEQEVTLQYYNSLKVALQYATGNATRSDEAIEEGTCSSDGMAEGSTVCLSSSDHQQPQVGGDKRSPQDSDKDSNDGNNAVPNSPHMGDSAEDIGDKSSESSKAVVDDELQDKYNPKSTYTGDDPKDWLACGDFWAIEDNYQHVEELNSHYQKIDVQYGQKEDDACLYLEGYLHTCASSRPHYHEVFVHYAARFLDEVKRVVFIGGGDSMVLHEVLKYPSLERVVGLELDQRVVRSTFKHFGTQPHFDNEKVQWYFGDAAKSLLALPTDYYGSFDLVIVDILTEVAEVLEVNHELKVMDAAMLLMKPGGIIVKNEDQGYVPGTNSDYTKYSVDLVFHDVPLYCLQIFVADSNSIDFLTAKPKDHNIEAMYLKGIDEFQSQFDSWYNFGGKESSARNDKCNINDDEPEEDYENADFVGVLMILEAENISTPLESVEAVKSSISEAMAKAGLNEMEYLSLPLGKDGVKGFHVNILAREGYVAARCNPELRYCAFDIQLYGEDIDKLEMVKSELLTAVQSSVSSSYRFVTGGIWGRNTKEQGKIGPPSAKKLCDLNVDDDTSATSERKVRKERKVGDFGKPEPSTLHAYNHALPLAQWKSQLPVATQALVQLEIPRFWFGEKVLVEKDGEWVKGFITHVAADFSYDIKYHGKKRVEKHVDEDRMRKLTDEFDKGVVSRFLKDHVDRLMESAGQTTTVPGSFAQKEVSDGMGDGLVIVTSWSGGNVVATWDGGTVASFNFFLSKVQVNLDELFVENIVDESIPILTLDSFPRGTGNVINFKEEITEQPPVWV